MKLSKKKLVSSVIAASLLLGGVAFTASSISANATGVASTSQKGIEELRAKALEVIPGQIVKQEYDFEFPAFCVEFKILDKNGRVRDIKLNVKDGSIWDLDSVWSAEAKAKVIPEKKYFDIKVTKEQAVETAKQKHAGELIRVDEEVERGQFLYEVLIRRADGMFVEVEVNATTGAVIKVDYDNDYDYDDYYENYQGHVPTTLPVNTQPAGAVQPPTSPTRAGDIGMDKARQIAQKQFPGWTIVKAERDLDDGRIEYEIELRNGHGEVELKIGQDGQVWDVDYDD